ncbi:MAG: hypothetical protein GIX03_12715 [Candidatus Eremiobacteraeota bacterium]|nr:hypothetical protein [Candidatus Eremiobacteraeota bacterium]MBC5803828.1 hypothetical protein [Candidatus Eremiobacteraeota bacterium]MBC5822418.1 hypothetical protein [Candidatus Eremiobacteraeota bacterium]
MLDILNTLAAVGTFVVIAATAIAAVVQLRHLRASNQLQGLLTVIAQVENLGSNASAETARKEAARLLDDPAYRKQLAGGSVDRTAAWIWLANSYDWVGNLVKHGLIPSGPLLDIYSGRVIAAWEMLNDFTAIIRRGGDLSIWENFEYLYVEAKAWERAYPAGNYPKNVERAVVIDHYLEADTALKN